MAKSARLKLRRDRSDKRDSGKGSAKRIRHIGNKVPRIGEIRASDTLEKSFRTTVGYRGWPGWRGGSYFI